jgi:hypothetical protein
MKKKFKYGLLCFILFLPAVFVSARAVQDFTKVIKKELDISAEGTLNITNKYGKVEVKTWDKNKVQVEVTILVKTRTQSQADEVFDRIRIEFSHSSGFVKAETLIDAVKWSWWDWGNSSSDYQINYLVYMPPSANLELYLRYGNAFVAALERKAHIQVKYGNFKSDGIGGRASIDLAYGNGTLTKTGNLEGLISYGSLSCVEAKDANITSKYSKVSIERAGVVRSTSKYDDYRLGEISSFHNSGNYDQFTIRQVGDLVMTTKYSNLSIGKLLNQLEMTASYGGAVIEMLDKSFSGITFVGKYSDLKINLEAGLQARLECSGNYANMLYPEGTEVRYERIQNQAKEVRGYLGSSAAKGIIKAELNYGNLRIRQLP